MNIAILLSTCDAYQPVANFTLGRLDTCWPDHPEVFICGLTRPALKPDACLPFIGNPRDWIGITLQAVTALEARGIEWLYLILDDHAPFGPCNAQYLNHTLPDTAARLGAIQVNLMGWDQHQPQAGTVLGASDLHWQRNAPDFRWKFSLHPGFWHVPTLARILRQLRASQPEALSARAFEGSMDRAARELDPDLCSRTYQVCGDGYAIGGRWFERPMPRRLALQGIHIARWTARLAGKAMLERLDRHLLSYLRYLNGPYPMFWSGLIQAGTFQNYAGRFLAWSGQDSAVSALDRLTDITGKTKF
ncbi:MAG: hypothetical protein WCS52_12835 [bacterium]